MKSSSVCTCEIINLLIQVNFLASHWKTATALVSPSPPTNHMMYQSLPIHPFPPSLPSIPLARTELAQKEAAVENWRKTEREMNYKLNILRSLEAKMKRNVYMPRYVSRETSLSAMHLCFKLKASLCQAE